MSGESLKVDLRANKVGHPDIYYLLGKNILYKKYLIHNLGRWHTEFRHNWRVIRNIEESIEEVMTIEELKEIIKELKNGESPGVDKITAEMITYLRRRE